MVLVEIDDEVWAVYARSMALIGTRTDEELVQALEDQLWEESNNFIKYAEKSLMADTPESHNQRHIGILKEMRGRYRWSRSK